MNMVSYIVLLILHCKFVLYILFNKKNLYWNIFSLMWYTEQVASITY